MLFASRQSGICQRVMHNIDDVLSDPLWLPHNYDPQSDRIQFLLIPIAAREKLTFLADFKPESDKSTCWISGETLRAASIDSVPVHFIFHSAFCRSTLLVKALGEFENSSGLSEPMIVNALQSQAKNDKALSLIPSVIALLGRPVHGEKTVIVKPSNFANGVIPALLEADPSSKAVIIYGSLREFLQSVAKKGLEGRLWARKQLAHNRNIIPVSLGLDERAFYELSDLQAAALAWLFHIRQFHSLVQAQSSRFRTLPSSEFSERKVDSLNAAADFFEIPDAAGNAMRVAGGSLFASHAKLGGDYEAIMAKQDAEARSKVTEEEIDIIAGWIDLILGQLGVSLPLRAKLI